MLIACPSCRRQYDVEHLQAGEKIRCACGELATVPAPRTRVARILHCASCGGHLEEGASRCAWCGGSISLEERNLGPACPECFARLAKGARHCTDCGVRIYPTAIRALRAEARCPRCAGNLHHCVAPQGEYTECRSCGGLWLQPEFFDRIVESRDLSPLGKGADPAVAGSPAPPPQELRYLPCPTCGEMMHRRNFGGASGVIVDWCKPHGTWFDTHELAKIIRFVSAGGLDRARQLELARAEQKLRSARHRAERTGRADPHVSIRGATFGDRAPFELGLDLDGALGAIASGLRRLFGR